MLLLYIGIINVKLDSDELYIYAEVEDILRDNREPSLDTVI